MIFDQGPQNHDCHYHQGSIVYHHIESHSDSAKFHGDNSTSSLYKLLVHVLLLEVHVYISNTGRVGTLVGIYYTTTVCTTTI